MKALAGRLVVVTGAARGIGFETAAEFARHGARLVISDLDPATLEQARQAIVELGAACWAQPCNVADADAVARLARFVATEVGAVDVLVNNAGVAFLGSFEETPLAQWRRTLDVNVLGVVNGIQAFLPAMKAAGGERKIVNVASLAGVAPAPNMCAYAASKHAVVGLSEVLAMELHDTPVSVLVVCPGIINTDIVRVPASTAPGISDAQVAKLQKYYVESGVLPDVVARGIVRSVRRDDTYLFVGPMARFGSIASRISRRLIRRLTIRGAYESGYLV